MTNIIWGYACISELNPTIKTGSTSRLNYINKLPLSERGIYLKRKAMANISALKQLLLKNAENKIQAYRLPDSFLPMADLGYYSISDFSKELEEIGQLANRLNQYISFHPSQFFVLNSINPQVVKTSIHNFNIFSDILSKMNLKNKPVLLTHVGAKNSYPSILAATEAFCKNYQLLSETSKEYFAVENDQSSHSIDSCLYINKKIGIPVVLDTAHYNYNPVKDLSLAEAILLSSKTWKNRVQKIHISSELEGSPRHAHADYITQQDFKDTIDAVKKAEIENFILMVEAKKKDKAVKQLRFDNPSK